MEKKERNDAHSKWKDIGGKLKGIGMDKLFLLVLAGILFMIAFTPSEKGTKDAGGETEAVTQSIGDYQTKLEEKLKNLLAGMEGVGEVQVLITFEGSEEKVLDKNIDNSSASLSEQDKEGGSRTSVEEQRREETVLRNNGSENGEPYVLKEVNPIVEGVVVLAEGGGSPTIAAEINEAVQALFNISPHKIKVLKKKAEG